MRDQMTKTGTKGAYQIGNDDAKESEKIRRSLKRKTEEEAATERRKKKEEEEAAELLSRVETFEAEMAELEMRSDETVNDNGVDDESESFTHRGTDDTVRAKANSGSLNKLHFPTAAEQSVRYSVSREATAAIVTETLVDVGVITKEDTSKIVTKRKIQLEVDRCLDRFQVH